MQSLWHKMLVSLLNCLRFSKLLKLHYTKNTEFSSILLKYKQFSRKTSVLQTLHSLGLFYLFL